MKPEEAHVLIIKYFNSSITAAELDCLNEWLEDEHNRKIFQSWIRLNYAINFNMTQLKSNRIASFIKGNIDALESKRRRVIHLRIAGVVSIAASILFGIFILHQKGRNTIEEPLQIVENNKFQPGSSKAILQLEDGVSITLDKDEKLVLGNAESDGELLRYSDSIRSDKALVYNVLTIPRGGYYRLELSDGSKVLLNADSRMRYPIQFRPNESREVILEYGEAYFDISPAHKNGGDGFQVRHSDQLIVVTGTEFNIKAYQEEEYVYSTLSEGQITISANQGRAFKLVPGDQAILSKMDHNLTVKTVDVNTEIAWIKGDFVFRRRSLEEITKVLGRWYNVEFKFENEALRSKRFTGELSRDQKLETILKLITNTQIIENYEIDAGKITLK
ncbi:FecR family protein [Robertkochia solimangrovi]|uniref:FecR family protein n=1 Tax=Robertkochia solimangrovi TaxID=2213046 RepID=UPI00117CECFF|nr:FecR domain-containing protein [Robertkochia solimangrovi]TRZ41978.1 hypothetical protein DMZ48_15185 [Robertkochia solimangrovi]